MHPWHIFWSQNARGYGMVVLGSILFLHRVHVLYGSGRAKDLLLAAAFLVLAAASHPTAAALVVGFLGFLYVRWALRKRYGGLAILLFAGFVAGPLPWLVNHYELFTDFREAKSEVSLLHWVETVAYYFRPSVLLAVLLSMLIAPRLLGANRALYLVCMLLVPMGAFTAVGGQLAKVTARYAICTLPVTLLLAGLLIGEVAQRIGQLSELARGRKWLLAGVLPALVAGARVLTVNHPTLLYYLRPRHWFVQDSDPHPDMTVQAIVDWRFVKGIDHNDMKLHEPGAEAHFAWHQSRAKFYDQMFAVVITLPALREVDRDGQFEATLKRDFELALYLPTWVGPKDESIYVYLPKKTE